VELQYFAGAEVILAWLRSQVWRNLTKNLFRSVSVIGSGRFQKSDQVKNRPDPQHWKVFQLFAKWYISIVWKCILLSVELQKSKPCENVISSEKRDTLVVRISVIICSCIYYNLYSIKTLKIKQTGIDKKKDILYS
jgi:hypothetical protein